MSHGDPQPQGSLTRHIVTGGVWTLGSQILVMIAQVVTLPLVQRLLGTEQMGVYLQISALVFIVAIVAQLGMAQTVVRLIAESLANNRPGRARAAIVRVLQVGFASGIVAAALIYFGVGEWLSREVFKSSAMLTVLGLTALWVLVQTVQRLFSEIFRGLHDLRLASVFRGVVSSSITAAVLFILWISKGQATLSDVLTISLAAFVVSGLLAVMVLRRKISRLRGEGNVAFAEILAISWPLMAATIANSVMARGDIWISGIYLTDTEVAIYGSAAHLVQLVAVPMVIANAVLAATISRLYTQGETRRLELIMRTVSTMSVIPALMILVPFVLFGEQILMILYSDSALRDGWPVIAILGIGQVVSLWAGVSTQLLIMAGRQMAVLVVTLLTVVSTLVASVLLVKSVGLYGIAAAFAFGVGFQKVVMAVYGARVLGLRTYMFWKPSELLAMRKALEIRSEQRQRRVAERRAAAASTADPAAVQIRSSDG
jgi:O-antigen/teichoic acid export membrane protein